jgi:hypothetical protein
MIQQDVGNGQTRSTGELRPCPTFNKQQSHFTHGLVMTAQNGSYGMHLSSPLFQKPVNLALKINSKTYP